MSVGDDGVAIAIGEGPGRDDLLLLHFSCHGIKDEAGRLFIEASRTGPADRPRELGRAVAMDLLNQGASDIIERSRPK